MAVIKDTPKKKKSGIGVAADFLAGHLKKGSADEAVAAMMGAFSTADAGSEAFSLAIKELGKTDDDSADVVGSILKKALGGLSGSIKFGE